MELVVDQPVMGELAFCPPLALHFFKNTQELNLFHPHFHKGKEYVWFLCILIFKYYESFSFAKFVTMLKVYLGLQGGDVEIEVDLHEVNYQIDIVRDHFLKIVKDVYAPQDTIHLFFRIFPDVQLHSNVFG